MQVGGEFADPGGGGRVRAQLAQGGEGQGGVGRSKGTQVGHGPQYPSQSSPTSSTLCPTSSATSSRRVAQAGKG